MNTRQRVNIFLQNVLRLTALHIITDTKLELIKNLSWLFDPELAFYVVYHSYKMGPGGQMIVCWRLNSSPLYPRGCTHNAPL